MVQETSKAIMRRMHDWRFSCRYFIGTGIDIGSGGDSLSKYSGFFPLMHKVYDWDLPQGDAHYMQGVDDNSMDFVHSSHCLEHMYDPKLAVNNWIRILRPGGHMVLLVPDEDLYEQGHWPSIYNLDHKTTWTIHKSHTWSPTGVNCTEFFSQFKQIRILKIELLDATFDYKITNQDQTLTPIGECAMEIILQKNM
jgi:SAM-dependent methyltransferase